MKIIGYGEDALTLWALKEKVYDIVGKDENIKVIIYRPSFGEVLSHVLESLMLL